ncbi:DUF3145 domain-containing protein [Propionimicrobium sp. PCR01-08-3]|uniref:DUF3145 domain-containing protein n=1 Tax=Propionimicrobium sp. PCR01-08-3 TaxID=3052086 RepID=UPI00255D053C|nr:DUF3145 domain-containing protein [Propionimicrobium sp. PCR01-08-3]WIY83703.1 DUF3145 domain-containing protein [Propionimicrobium sp. PCR01-08-3]
MGTMSRGVVFVHSAPAALCPHIEWAIGAVVGMPVNLEWIEQPAEPGMLRTEYSWTGPQGASAGLASALRACQRVRFEVTEDATPAEEGQRYAFTPELGVFHAVTGPHGDIQISEHRLRTAMATAAHGGISLEDTLSELLGEPWDDELEVFRYAGEDTPVRWLHRVG